MCNKNSLLVLFHRTRSVYLKLGPKTGHTILFTLFVAKNGHEDIIVDTFAIIKDTTRSLRGQAVFDDSKT